MHGGGEVSISLNIDPGPVQSALVTYDIVRALPTAAVTLLNSEIVKRVRECRAIGVEFVACEMIASYGMAVGRSVFETCLWTGRFWEAAEVAGLPVTLIYRREVKLHLCGSSAAKDANVRQALLDLYGTTKADAIGKKTSPGPLYGISGDEWAALGVARTFADTKLPKTPFHP